MNQQEMFEYLEGKILALERTQAILMGVLISQDENQSLKGQVRDYLQRMMDDMQMPERDIQSSSSPVDALLGFNRIFSDVSDNLSQLAKQETSWCLKDILKSFATFLSPHPRWP